MKILLSVFTAAACFALAYAVLDNRISERIRILRPADQAEVMERKELRRKKCLFWAILIALGSGAGVYSILWGTSDIIHIIKLLIGLICLVGSGCMDYKEHRIPNFFPLVLALSSVALLTLGFFTGQTGAMSYIAGAVISTVAVVLLLTLASLLTKGGIGPGDIKLLGALALMGDIYLLCGTMLFGVVSCSAAGVVLLIRKKKTSKEGLPFGPFLLIGYLLSLYIQMF